MLSDNEKAATFIGWKPTLGPSTVCFCGHTAHHHGALKPSACNKCCCNKYDKANKPAPDLSDPRNYMKALEGLGRRTIWWELYWDDATSQVALLITAHFIYQRIENSVVRALAALYDAEHAND